MEAVLQARPGMFTTSKACCKT